MCNADVSSEIRYPTKPQTRSYILVQYFAYMKEIVIREYTVDDFNNLCELLKLNIPTYFAMEEFTDFEKYLKDEIENYYVAEWDGNIVGCGGINFNRNENIALISWDIMHPNYQGKGVGSIMLKHRLNFIKQHFPSYKIMVRTSQLVYKFYEKHGFHLLEKHSNFWAEGFDMYKMEYLKK